MDDYAFAYTCARCGDRLAQLRVDVSSAVGECRRCRVTWRVSVQRSAEGDA